MAKPRLVQILCGTARHCILALAYLPSAIEQDACETVLQRADAAIAAGEIDPWCCLCKSGRSSWFAEDRELPYATIEEALPALLKAEADQKATSSWLRAFRN